jgi:hypothetical protein
MVRQRQADLLLIAATVIAACGWIFSREAIAGMPVFAFLGLRFFSPRCCCCRSAAVFARKSSTGQTHHQRTVVCAQPVPVDLFGLDDGVARRRGVYHEPVDDVRPADRVGDDEGAPAAGLLGVPADRGGGLGLLSLHMPIAFHPSQGWFLLTALVQSIWFCYTSRCAREVPLIP